jgi:hypothetical protein
MIRTAQERRTPMAENHQRPPLDERQAAEDRRALLRLVATLLDPNARLDRDERATLAALFGRVLERAQTQGQEFSPAAIAHVSPLARRHVIVNGTYDFSPSQNRHAEEELCV